MHYGTHASRILFLGFVLAVWAGMFLGCKSAPLLGQSSHPPRRNFLIIGHRGAPNQACENTLESFAAALRLGANAVELDVSMTQDGHLVLWHDAVPSVKNSLRSTGACSLIHPLLPQPVHTVPLAEFRRDYGYEYQGQRVPVTTLTDMARRFGKETRIQFFFLDLKLPADQAERVPLLFQRAVHTLRQYGALSKAVLTTPYENIFYALHDEAQRWYQARGKRVDLALDVEGPQIVDLDKWPSTVLRNQVADARFALWGEPFVSLQSSRDFVRAEIQRRNAINATRSPQARLRFIVWTVNDKSELCELVGLGVDGIMTDEPARLRTIVRDWDRQGTCQSS